MEFDLVGLGVLLIGLALLILAISFAQVLRNFASILKGVDRTVQQLPEQLDHTFEEVGNLLHTSNDTLSDVNVKLSTLTPVFQIVGDLGDSTRHLSAGVANISKSTVSKIGQINEASKKKAIGRVYGSSTLAYYLFRKGKDQKISKGWKKFA